VRESRVSKLEEQVLLAGDPLEILEQLVLDPPFGPGVDSMNRFNKQLDERINEGSSTEVCEDRESA
jgi:hypothetical protein